MATDFTQDSVLHFIQVNGGRVKNSELLFHYKAFLRDNENKTQYRELFKRFVNSVAVVKQEEGVSYVVLRKKFGGQARDVSSSPRPSSTPAGRKPETPARGREEPAAETRHRDPGVCRHLTERHLAVEAPCDTGLSPQQLLPSAGILLTNNNNEDKLVSFQKPIQSSSPYAPVPAPERASPSQTASNELPPFPHITATPQASGVSCETCETFEAARFPKETLEAACPKGPVTLPEPNEPKGIYTSIPGQPRETQAQRKPFCPPHPPDPQYSQELSVDQDSIELPRCEQVEQRAIIGHGGQRLIFQAGYDDDDDRRSVSPALSLPLSQTALERAGRISSSSSCISDSRDATPPLCQSHPARSDRGGRLHPPQGGVPDISIERAAEESAAAAAPVAGLQRTPRHSLPLEPDYHYHPPLLGHPPDLPPPHHHHLHRHPTHLSASHGCLLPSSADSSPQEWSLPMASPPVGAWTGEEEMGGRGGGAGGGLLLPDHEVKVREMLRRAREAEMLSLLHRAERKVNPPWHRSAGHLPGERGEELSSVSSVSWHHSAGHLDSQESETSSSLSSPWRHSAAAGALIHHDRGEETSSTTDSDPGSASSSGAPQPRPPAVRRISSRLRSRMCRSLGADLDQPFPEDDSARRRNRLQLISSSLNLRYQPSSRSTGCTPSHSYHDLTMPSGGGSRHSSPPLHGGGTASYSHRRQDPVPLEPTEHEWLVKGASGTWTDIYSLFRDEPTLLNKRDFVTGYTVLHWIAKHGDHRVLNTLWYGVSKLGMTLDINARTTCGYTPLHLAAIHDHKKMLRLLVYKFRADVRLRDTSGKKAWQYLGRGSPKDLLALLGAPQPRGGGAKTGAMPVPRSSSAEHLERKDAASDATKVKRSTSVAAFLKHKTLMRFPGHHSDSLV